MFNKIKSGNYEIMIALMQYHKKQLIEDKFQNVLIFNKEQWFCFLKKKIKNTNLKQEEITDNFISFSKENKRFNFSYKNILKSYIFEMLPQGYKYQYFNYKRWEYVQHDQIKCLTKVITKHSRTY